MIWALPSAAFTESMTACDRSCRNGPESLPAALVFWRCPTNWERPGCPSKGNQVLYRSLGEDKSKVWGWQVNKMYTLVARLITIDSSQFEQPPLLGWLHESIQSSTLPQTLVFTVQEPPANRQDTKAKASPLYWGLV